MGKQNSTYFSPTCFFCGKNNKRRHSRVGRSWTCVHCHEINPGPAMLRSMMKQLGGHAESREPANGAAAPAAQPKVAVTKIRGVAVETVASAKKTPKKEPVAASSAPAVTQPKPSPAPRPASPPSPKKRGFLEGLVYG